ncbi:hypothetical protein TSUD_236930 [Trifolium subterraneum]|uniref:Pre-mRNA-splicing factor Syf1-like N-terminal HAT-repeats domain-containing protein n=1 Tax=Trifolium subterraneum TaxID=3900 RepID=A0A2Z6PGT6_TRISU|nr:hypothetical protein TSUD_236930 [Trifolium subterraneum]
MKLLSRAAKNKNYAPIQITAEQIVHEAKEEAEIHRHRPPKFKINDGTELADYRLRKRKEFEDLIRRVGWNVKAWVKYAEWEESQKQFDRARSVWERVLVIDHKNHTLWLKYAEFEMKNRFINHARNVFERAITILPRVDQLWYKYIHMENMLGNVAGVRGVFERWMDWMPDGHAWMSYIKFELKYKEIQRTRDIFERFVLCHPTVTSWIRYAKFEIKNGDACSTRKVFERSLDEVAAAQDDQEAQKLFIAFADFEASCNETERAKHVQLRPSWHYLDSGGSEKKNVTTWQKQNKQTEPSKSDDDQV